MVKKKSHTQSNRATSTQSHTDSEQLHDPIQDCLNPYVYPWLENNYQDLVNLFSSKKLPNVCLLYGPKGLGKSSMAVKLGQTFSNSNKFKVLGLNSTSNNLLKIDEVRSVVTDSGQTDLYSTNKVVIITNVEFITKSAANALLKVLEDNQNTFFIFTSNNISQIIPTLLSRCFKINCSAQDTGLISKQTSWLILNGIDSQKDRDFLLDITNYAPIAVLNLHKQNFISLLTETKDVLKSLSRFSSTNNNKNIMLITAQNKIKHIIQVNNKFDSNTFISILYYLLSNSNILYNRKTQPLLAKYQKYIDSGIAIDTDNMVYNLLYSIVQEQNNHTHV